MPTPFERDITIPRTLVQVLSCASSASRHRVALCSLYTPHPRPKYINVRRHLVVRPARFCLPLDTSGQANVLHLWSMMQLSSTKHMSKTATSYQITLAPVLYKRANCFASRSKMTVGNCYAPAISCDCITRWHTRAQKALRVCGRKPTQ